MEMVRLARYPRQDCQTETPRPFHDSVGISSSLACLLLGVVSQEETHAVPKLLYGMRAAYDEVMSTGIKRRHGSHPPL